MKIDRLTNDDWARVHPRRLQRSGRVVTRRIGRWLFRYQGYGRERIPATGGFIIAPNHGSYVDPFFFLHGTNRTVRFMAKYQALEWPIVGRFIKWGGGFPTNRPGGAGRPVLDIARCVLEAGNGLIMFMEGKLVREPGLGTPRSGLAVLALNTGVPVVPVAAWGNKPAGIYGRKRRFWQRPKVTVVWGEPMSFPREDNPSAERVAEVRDQIWAQVTRLHAFAHELHERPGGRPATWQLPSGMAPSAVAPEPQSVPTTEAGP
ncbi:MAG: 1-acyl-sn-glycerol-3-phosphate acyltransferase [Thermoleophilia bacterium]|nr:1-acyl-sn-glycerol-3-phosphate acyltransferase [Thermoleophilia bacterium]